MVDLCVYCGVIANERDHLKARKDRKANQSAKLTFGFVSAPFDHIKTVPSCSDCNFNLRGCTSTDIRGRAAFLVQKHTEILNNKYSRKRKIEPERLAWLRAVTLLPD